MSRVIVWVRFERRMSGKSRKSQGTLQCKVHYILLIQPSPAVTMWPWQAFNSLHETSQCLTPVVSCRSQWCQVVTQAWVTWSTTQAGGQASSWAPLDQWCWAWLRACKEDEATMFLHCCHSPSSLQWPAASWPSCGLRAQHFRGPSKNAWHKSDSWTKELPDKISALYIESFIL